MTSDDSTGRRRIVGLVLCVVLGLAAALLVLGSTTWSALLGGAVGMAALVLALDRLQRRGM